jgi:hypothetical protein
VFTAMFDKNASARFEGFQKRVAFHALTMNFPVFTSAATDATSFFKPW